MTKEIKIRNCPEKMYLQLKEISKKYDYASLNEFMLAQIESVVMNDGLDLYQNQFAESLADIKEQQSQILENQRLIEIRQIDLDAKQDVVEELMTNWLRFMDDVEALQSEEEARRKNSGW